MEKFKNIDEYIASFPKNVQVILEELRKAIIESAPEAIEMISYGMPAFKSNGILVYFAAHKHHIGFYPTASGITAFSRDLISYKQTKGTVKFPIDKPIPIDLVKKIVRFRVKENKVRVENKRRRTGK